MTQEKYDITPETKISDLLNNFPLLENKLIELAPAFSKLKNPVLRNTIAKIATIKQASLMGNVPLSEMINFLRKEAGLSYAEIETQTNLLDPNDEIETPDVIYDARIDLDNGVHPVGKVLSALKRLNTGEKYLLITPFLPAPLIEKAKDMGVSSAIKKINEAEFHTIFKL